MRYSVEFFKRVGVETEVKGQNFKAWVSVKIMVNASEMMEALGASTEVLKQVLGTQADKNYELIDISKQRREE